MNERVAIAVSADLLARSRLEDAASRAGWRVVAATEQTLVDALASADAELLVLDLDSGGAALLERVAQSAELERLPRRVVGFFSHVDADLGRAAEAAGCEAMPRGRFWRSLPELFSAR